MPLTCFACLKESEDPDGKEWALRHSEGLTIVRGMLLCRKHARDLTGQWTSLLMR